MCLYSLECKQTKLLMSSPRLGSIKLGSSATYLLKDLFMDTKLYSKKKKKGWKFLAGIGKCRHMTKVWNCV
jgi:hypothetical protein